MGQQVHQRGGVAHHCQLQWPWPSLLGRKPKEWRKSGGNWEKGGEKETGLEVGEKPKTL